MARLLCAAVCLVTWLARSAPRELGPVLDEIAQDLMGYSRFVKPMPREACFYGRSFIAAYACESIDCRHTGLVMSLGQVDPEADLACEVCGDQSAGIT